mgnify:CR=1 FL=1
MEYFCYFIWFCMGYTLYRVYVLLGVLGSKVREMYRARKIREAGWAYIENSVQSEVPAVLPEVPCVDGEVW